MTVHCFTDLHVLYVMINNIEIFSDRLLSLLSGLMQFQVDPLPTGMILPAPEDAQITVAEERGIASIIVARAQGLVGDVMVGYRTIPFTAISSKDYKVFHMNEHTKIWTAI